MSATTAPVIGTAVPASDVAPPVSAPPDAAPVPPKAIVWIGLVMDIKKGVWTISIGRLLLLITFAHAMITWMFRRDISLNELQTLWALLTYVTGSKVADCVKGFTRC